MKDFRFKDEWKEHNKSIGIVVLLTYLVTLFVFNYIKDNTNNNGLNLDLPIVLLIVVGTIIIFTIIVTIICITIFSIKAKSVDVHEMFPEVKKCPIFSTVEKLSLSSKKDILKWYNIVEYSEIEAIEKQIDPTDIVGDEHVWLVTSDLGLELNDIGLISTMKDNISKGVKYTYFLPDNENSALGIEKLNNIYGEDKIRIVLLNKESELLFQLFDVIIFNPIYDYSKAFICVDFINPRKYRRLTNDDAHNLITKLHKELQERKNESKKK